MGFLAIADQTIDRHLCDVSAFYVIRGWPALDYKVILSFSILWPPCRCLQFAQYLSSSEYNLLDGMTVGFAQLRCN